MKKKRWIALCAVMLMLTAFLPSFVRAEDAPRLEAEAAVLIDMTSGNTLFEKNAQQKMFPASTTKVMTALLTIEAMERGELSSDEILTVREGALDALPFDGSKVGLQSGEQMSVRDLLRGLLIASGNDAAIVLAERVSGSEEQFVQRMNERVQELGLSNTHFVNPHGLHDEQHYTTASDLAAIAREAMKHEAFRDVVDIAHVYLDETNMSPQRYFINTNNLVSRYRYRDYFYDKATGIKTGSTTEAGNCLVASAKDGDRELISVVLKCKESSISHTDSKTLLEYGFRNFKSVTVAHKDDLMGEVSVKQGADGKDYVSLSAASDFAGLLPNEAEAAQVQCRLEVPEVVYAPVAEGAAIGRAVFSYEGKELGAVSLTAVEAVARHPLGFLMSFGEWVWSFRALRVAVYIVLGCVAGFFVLLVIGFVRALRKSKRKKRRTSSYSPPPYYQKK